MAFIHPDWVSKDESMFSDRTYCIPIQSLTHCIIQVFPVRSDGKDSACVVGDLPGFDPWLRKISWRRKWQSTPVFFPRVFHGPNKAVFTASGSLVWTYLFALSSTLGPVECLCLDNEDIWYLVRDIQGHGGPMRAEWASREDRESWLCWLLRSSVMGIGSLNGNDCQTGT